MRHLASILLATTCFPLIVTAASGADSLYSPTAVHDWSGNYVGIQLGYGTGSSDAYELLSPSGAYVDGPLGYTADGFTGGIHFGRNAVTGKTVFGIEADAEIADINGTWDWQNGNTLTKRIDWTGSLRARFGYAADQVLVYATAGVAAASVNMAAVGSGAVLLSGSETTIGWTVGGGVEYALDGMWSVRGEYRYTDYGDTSVAGNAYGLVEEFTHSNKVHAVRFGFSRKF